MNSKGIKKIDSNVSVETQPEQRLIMTLFGAKGKQIICICKIFLHWIQQNMSSDCLLQPADSHMTSCLQMLISQMLQVNVDTRFTAEEVLSHPWVTVRAQTHTHSTHEYFTHTDDRGTEFYHSYFCQSNFVT